MKFSDSGEDTDQEIGLTAKYHFTVKENRSSDTKRSPLSHSCLVTAVLNNTFKKSLKQHFSTHADTIQTPPRAGTKPPWLQGALCNSTSDTHTANKL